MTEVGKVGVTLGLNSDEFVKAWSDADDKITALEKNLKKSQQQFKEVSLAMAGTNKPSKELVNTYKQLKSQLQQDQSALDKFNKKIKKLDGGLTQAGKGTNLLQGALGKLATGGAIVMLTKQFVDFSKESVAAFRVQDRALKSLDTALQNSGVYTSEYAQHLRDLSSEIQSFSNYGDEAVEKAIALGQSYSGNIELTDELIKAVVDYAAATETDLNTAFTLVGKSIGTSTNALACYGVELDQNMSKEEKAAVIAQTLGQRFTGAANDMADSSVQLQNAVGDLSEAFGQLLDPSVQKTEGLLTRLAQKFTTLINQIRIYDSELNKLNYNELEQRLAAKQKEIEFTQKTSVNTPRTKAYIERLQKETKEITAQMEVVKKAEAEKAAASKTTYRPIREEGIGTSKTQKQQDKALETYKKYVEEYQKITQNYEATLQARQYIEGTLNIDSVKQQQEYDQALKVYQAYFAKIQEINTSGARNKAELLKLNEENLARELQEIRVNKELETQRKLNKIIEGYQDERREYERTSEAEQELGGFLGRFTTGYKERLELLKWYYTEHEKISSEHYTTLEEQQRVFNELDQTYAARNAQIQKDIWQKRGEEIQGILSQSFDTMLTNYGDFSDNMKQLVLNLSRYLIKEAFQMMYTQITSMRGAQEGLSGIFQQMFGQANQLAQSYVTIAQGAMTANASTQAMTTAQAALAPLSATVSAQMMSSAAQYATAAAGAQQLAAAIAQLAVAEAAYSVAKIPFVGGFLAPVAATATGAAIAAATALVAGASFLGSTLNKAGSVISNIGGGVGRSIASPAPLSDLPIYHSGGIVPGTKEQLAVLQGGERVLNRSENASYSSGETGAENGINNIMMFNIKAWDGKDVIQTLKANSQTINQIVNSGIKNNQQGLRSTVQNI